MSSSVKAAQSGRVISPHAPPIPHSDHQPTCSGSLSTVKAKSESALAPIAALILSSLGIVVGWGMQVCGQMVLKQGHKILQYKVNTNPNP